MRKLVATLQCLLLILFSVVACDFDAPLRSRMLEYYSNNANYIEIHGVVKNVRHIEEINELRLEIQVVTNTEELRANAETGWCLFKIVDYDINYFSIDINDDVIFCTAPRIFYDGHIIPIVSLERNNIVLLDFEDGKAKYLSWINAEFN